MDEPHWNEHLNISLPFPVKVIAVSKKIVDSYLIKYYTVRLDFRNISAEFDIYQDDPRYETIKQFLKDNGIFKEANE